MSIEEIKASTKEMLTPQDVAPILGVNPQSLRMQAQRNVAQLGFSASYVGNRLLIPRKGFITWYEGGRA